MIFILKPYMLKPKEHWTAEDYNCAKWDLRIHMSFGVIYIVVFIGMGYLLFSGNILKFISMLT